MIVSIHQPHFLPWMGYFNKAFRSEIFVWLHSVQYRKNYYQNRTQIKNINEQPLWLTLPVHARLGMPIDQVAIADSRWRERIAKTLEQCYGKAAHFSECWPSIANAIAEASDNLDDVNYRTFKAILKLLGNECLRVVRADDLHAESSDPTERLVEICRSLNATTYIAGTGGRNYLRVDDFEKAGIKVLWQAFDPTLIRYAQMGNVFVPGLSIVDSLFSIGPESTRQKVLKAWSPN